MEFNSGFKGLMKDITGAQKYRIGVYCGVRKY